MLPTETQVETTEAVTVPPSEPVPDALNPYNKPLEANADYSGNLEYVRENIVRFELYTPDLYPAEAVEALQPGDRIAVDGDVIEVTSIKYEESPSNPLVYLNGNTYLMMKLSDWDYSNLDENGYPTELPGDYVFTAEDGSWISKRLTSIDCELNEHSLFNLTKTSENGSQQEILDVNGVELLELLKAGAYCTSPQFNRFYVSDGSVLSGHVDLVVD